MMIKLPFADSIVGPSVMRTRSASLAGGSIWVSGTGGEAKEPEHHKLAPRVMITPGETILDTCNALITHTSRRVSHNPIIGEGDCRAHGTFHAPCRFDDNTLCNRPFMAVSLQSV